MSQTTADKPRALCGTICGCYTLIVYCATHAAAPALLAALKAMVRAETYNIPDPIALREAIAAIKQADGE